MDVGRGGAQAGPEEEADGEEIGAEEAGDDEGDHGVEGFGRADVDEGEEEGDEGCDADRAEGEFSAGVDLGGSLRLGLKGEREGGLCLKR